MNSEDYLRDISEIKTLMNKSSRFISLSGLSGILAGIYALIGAFAAYWHFALDGNESIIIDSDLFRFVIIDLLAVGIFSIITAIYLTTRKAKQNNEKTWDSLTKRLLLNFIIPLVAGGVYMLIILNQQKYGQIAALMLLFYGLSLLNASKYTLGDIKYLSYTQIFLGLACAIYSGYGFWFWVVGFGFMHIIYGIVMYLKYDRK